MERILHALGVFCARAPRRVLGLWVFAALALLLAGQSAGGTFVNDFQVPGMESQKALDTARDHFPEVGAVTAEVVWQAQEGSLDTPARQEAVRTMLADIAAQPDVAGVSRAQPSPDGGAASATVDYSREVADLSTAHYQRLKDAADGARDSGVRVEMRGMVVDLATMPETGPAEMIGLGVALLVLVVAFGSLVAAGLPLVVAIFGIVVGTALVLLIAAVIDIPTSAPIVAIMLGLGTGIDYALFVLARFRTALREGADPVAAAGRATARAGHAVVFAGGTVVLAILGLNLAGISFIGAMGTAAALTVGVMVLAAVTLLPALFGLLGHRVNALPVRRRGRARAETRPEHNLAHRWAAQVQRHRVPWALVSLLVLGILAAPAFSLRLGTPDDGTQPTDLTQRRAYDIVSEHFGPGWNGPLLITVTGDGALADRLVGELSADREVETVLPARRSADGTAWLVTVVPRHAPQDEEVSELVHRIRRDVAPRVEDAPARGEILVGGSTAMLIDMADIIGGRLPWVILAVVSAGMLLLLGMFRAPVIALKAALMTVLSIGAAFGVVTAVFQWGWGLELTGLDKTVPIMSMVPMLMFAVLFGLSMDYEVFLMSAVAEEYRAQGDPRRALLVGIGNTAGVITAAAVIMSCVFLGFLGVSDNLVIMLGVGLASAVILDATVIRLVLVPAVMGLLGDVAWWRPGRRSGEGLTHGDAPGAADPLTVPEQGEQPPVIRR
ncbi:MAG: putative drug exporter of the superfamily [Actinomycetota bacterium]|nr:putative drug exporter of the superfamily [Actinomycetota bacterium]